MEVHRCRFVDYTPATINALAFAPSTCQRPYAACARASGDIEIWSPLNNWHLERTIPGSTRASVEALAWTHQTEPCDSEVDEDNGKDDETDAEGDIEPDKKAKGRNLVEKKAKRTAQRKNGRQPTQPYEREKKRLHALPPRLFTAGLDAILREWDLDTLRPKKVIDSHGGAVWCVAASNDQKRLAIGCEDGRVRIFDVADGRLEYIKALDPHRGRVLSLAWDPTDSYIVTGSAESTINKYDVESGRSVARMLVEKASKSEHTIVWAIKVLADGTVVSGDSLGHVKFWDLRMGVLRQSISSHAADVLCLAVGRDSTTVFSSGVDRVVNRYKVVEVQDALDATKPSRPKASRSVPAADSAASATAEPRQAAGPQKKWVISGRRRYHSHDVRALALDESKRVNALVSGGVDVQLVVCPAAEFPALNQRRLPFFPHRPVVSFVKAKRWVVAALFDKLRIWLLGKGGPTTGLLEEKRAEILPIVEHQRRLLEMQLQGGRHITAFDVSMDAKWIAVADIDSVKLFSISETSSGTLKVRKAKSFFESFALKGTAAGGGAFRLKFTSDSRKLVIATAASQVVLVDLSLWSPENTEAEFPVLKRFDHHRGAAGGDNSSSRGDVSQIISLDASLDGQWIATGDLLNRIFVFNVDTLQLQYAVPRHSTQHTLIRFAPQEPFLIVSLASNELFVFDVEARSLTVWSRRYSSQLPEAFVALKDKITGISFNPARPHELTCWGATYACFVDMTRPVHRWDVINPNKRKRHHDWWRKQGEVANGSFGAPNGLPGASNGSLGASDDSHGATMMDVQDCRPSRTNFQVLHKYQPLLLLDYASEDVMVVVERPWFDILGNLPPSFYKPKFGT